LRRRRPRGERRDEVRRRRLRLRAVLWLRLHRFAAPLPPQTPLAPSDAVARLQGRDIVRRGGQRKSRFLFSFPGLLTPAASAGRVGELADLGTKNPLLYLEFSQVGFGFPVQFTGCNLPP
jgi:hypothetical protein